MPNTPALINKAVATVASKNTNSKYYKKAIEILNSIVYFTYATKNNYIYCKDKNCFIQFKIIKDDENNFLEIKKIGEYTLREKNFYSVSKAILPFDDGRIFILANKNQSKYYQIMA